MGEYRIWQVTSLLEMRTTCGACACCTCSCPASPAGGARGSGTIVLGRAGPVLGPCFAVLCRAEPLDGPSGTVGARPARALRAEQARPVRLLRIFGRILKSLRSRWGLGPCNQSIASGFGAAEIKIGFWRFLAVFGRPPLLSARWRGGCTRPAQRPPRLCAPFWVCLSRQNNQRQPMEGPLMAIKASLRADADSKKSLRSLARNQSHRAEPMHRA
jgi:hypothetical protein